MKILKRLFYAIVLFAVTMAMAFYGIWVGIEKSNEQFNKIFDKLFNELK